MNKKLRVLVLSIITIIFLLNSGVVIDSVNEAFNIFYEYIFLSMFPFLILSSILINYNYPYYIGKLFGNIFNKLFHLNNESAFVFFISMITGHPTNAIFIKELLDEKRINIAEAERLLICSYFPNPMFVIGTIGFNLYGSAKTGIYILVILYITNFIIAFILRGKEKVVKNSITLKQPKPLFKVIRFSFFSAFKTLLLILGNITIFIIVVNIFNKYMNFNPFINTILSSILEITNGNAMIVSLDIKLKYKIALTLFSLIFSGICIHSQVISILEDYKLNYKKLLMVRLIVAFIISLTFILIT